PISRMVLNDVGPHLPQDALERIGEYVNDPTDFASFEDAVAYMRTVNASFGEHTDSEWQHLTRYVVKQEGNRWLKDYDPAIGRPFAHWDAKEAAAGEAILWRAFEAIACPTLLLRGRRSDLLLEDTAQEMVQRNKNVRLVQLEDVGHAPTLMNAQHLELVAEFLLRG